MTEMDAVLTRVAFDEEGYMVDANAWNPAIAEAIAAREGITLTERHWAVINFARADWKANGEAPGVRALGKNTGLTTKELYQLFPGGPGKLSAKIAGLKKPTGCI